MEGVDDRDHAMYAVIDVGCRAAIDCCGRVTPFTVGWKRGSTLDCVVSWAKEEAMKGESKVLRSSRFEAFRRWPFCAAAQLRLKPKLSGSFGGQ